MIFNPWLEKTVSTIDYVDAIITVHTKEGKDLPSILKKNRIDTRQSVRLGNSTFIITRFPLWLMDKIPDTATVSYNTPQGLLITHDPLPDSLKIQTGGYLGKALYQSRIEMPSMSSIRSFSVMPFSGPEPDNLPIFVPSYDIVKSVRGNTKLTGKGVKVAVIDTGFSIVPPQWRLGRKFEAYSSIIEPPSDGMGHGTDVANTMCGGFAESPYGNVSGVAPGADLISIKALNLFCVGRASDILVALRMAVIGGAKVINLSLGSFLQGSVLDDPLCVAVDEIVNTLGRVVVAAAGNNVTEWSIRSPGASPAAITVGSLSWTDKALSWFSSRGPNSTWYKENMDIYHEHLKLFGDDLIKPDCVSYGGGRMMEDMKPDEYINNGSIGWGETMYDGKADMYGQWHGSSQSSPVVAGLIALALEKDPSLTPVSIKKRIAHGPKNTEYGHGLVRLSDLV